MNDDDINQQILAELRKLRKGNQAASIVCIVALFILIIWLVWYRTRSYRAPHQAPPAQTDSWDDVRAARDRFEYEKAFDMAQRIAARNPNDYYSYAYLGSIALATGRAEEAEKDYARACELLPSKENEEMLQAIRKRLERQGAAPPTPAK